MQVAAIHARFHKACGSGPETVAVAQRSVEAAQPHGGRHPLALFEAADQQDDDSGLFNAEPRTLNPKPFEEASYKFALAVVADL